MIRRRTLAGLVVLGAGSLAGGWFVSRPTEPGVMTPRPALPALLRMLPSADRVQIAQGGRTLTLERRGQSWGLANRGGYPVRQDMVRRLLNALAELRLLEPRTADPAQLGRLGLDAASGTLVSVLEPDGAAIGAIIAGHARVRAAGPAELYVRPAGQAQSWLAQGAIQASTDQADWLDRDILAIDPARVAAAQFTRGDDVLVLRRDAGRVVMQTPADHPPIDDASAAETFAALSKVTFTDVRPAPQVKATPIGTARLTLEDGTAIEAAVGSAGGAVWAQFSATGPQAGPIQARAAGWAFQFPEWTEATFLPVLATLEAR
jgi:Domain of unknown function (DUF4340)